MAEPQPPPVREVDPTRFRRALLWGFLLAALLALALGALMAPRWLRQSQPQQAVPLIGRVPDFELVNRDGRPVSRRDLLGQPWVADFVFTRCRVSCPAMTQRMASLVPRLRTAGARSISVTVDPDYDRPQVLADYAASFGAADDWLFLTGGKEQIYELIQGGFKLGVQPAAPDEEGSSLEPITHSTRFVLVDSEGQIRGYYDAFDPAAVARLFDDLSRLHE